MTPQSVRDEPVAPDERNEPQTREQLIVALRVLAQDTEDDDEMLVTVKEDTYVWLAADMLRADAGKDATIERLTAEAHEWRRATQAGIDMATARGEEIVKLHDELAKLREENEALRKSHFTLRSALNAAAGWLDGYCPEAAKHLIGRINAALAAPPTARAGHNTKGESG